MELTLRYRVTALKDLSLRANICNAESGEITMETFVLFAGESRDDIVCILRIFPSFGVPEWQLIPHPSRAVRDRREFHDLIRLERLA